uniref:Uncharacterized protein n=1 Tax=Phocoena sinus TaxID=42100 RepID=A0A8C9CTW2_PHOSS
MNEILAGQNNLGCRLFPFITLNVSCHSLLACRVSAERSAVNLMGIPLYVICCFSLAAFNIFSLILIFDSLINMCLGMFLLGFILYGTLCAYWTLLSISFPILGKFTTIISSNIFSVPFFFSSAPGTPYNSNVGTFNIVPEVSKTVLNSFHSFFFILICSSYFHYFIFQVTYPFFCLSYSATDSF